MKSFFSPQSRQERKVRKDSYLLCVLRALCGFAVIFSLLTASTVHAADRESTFDRVMRTKTIRCGYVVYPPAFNKDPNTGAFSGIMYDITEKLGKKLGLKINWAEEVNYGSMFEGLSTGRYDMLCINGWNISSNAPYATPTQPLFYSVINAVARANDTRFDNNLAAINNPKVTVSSIDGALPGILAREQYPKATVIDLPQNTDYSAILLNVTTGKADVAFIENAFLAQFMAKNPGKIRIIKTDHPLQYYANSYLVGIGDVKMQSLVNTALGEILGSGYIDTVLAPYKTSPPSYLPVAKPYEELK